MQKIQEEEQSQLVEASSMPDNTQSQATATTNMMVSYPASCLVEGLRENGAQSDIKQRRVSLERITTKNEKRRQSLPVLPSYFTPLKTPAKLAMGVKKERKGVKFPLGILMQQAVTDGDLPAIKALIRSEGSRAVEEREPNGLPPIMRAIFEDQPASLKFLLDSGANVAARDPEDWTALHVAAAMDDLEAAELILENAGKKQEFTSAVNMDGERAIDLAESLEMARLLLHADLVELRVEQSKQESHSLRAERSLSNEGEVLQLVQDHCEKHSNSTALDDVLKANTCYSSLLHLAASKNYPQLASYVVGNRLSSLEVRDKNGWTPLHTAAYYNCLDVSLILVEHGANVHALSHSYEKPTDLTQHQLILTLLEGPRDLLDSM